MRALWLMLALAPAPALSEGAVQTFACVTSATHDDKGTCAPLGSTSARFVTFRIEPVSVSRDGSGHYELWQSFDPTSARSVVTFLSCEVTQ